MCHQNKMSPQFVTKIDGVVIFEMIYEKLLFHHGISHFIYSHGKLHQQLHLEIHVLLNLLRLLL